jgi:hypothetical protein
MLEREQRETAAIRRSIKRYPSIDVALDALALEGQAIRDGLTVEHHPYPSWGILEVQRVRLEYRRVEVKRPGALSTERSSPNRQGHRVCSLFRRS